MSEESTLVELFERACQHHATRPALGRKTSSGFEWTTFEQLKVLVGKARAWLTARGIGPGDTVAIISDNRLEWAILCYATAGLGAVFVPMYTAQSASDWRYILGDSGARLCLVETAALLKTLKDSEQPDSEQPNSEQPDSEQPDSEQPDSEQGIGGALATPFHLLEGTPSFLQQLETVELPPPPVRDASPSDLAALIYTSGTTGKPKGVQLTHSNLVYNAVTGALEFEIGPADRSLSFLPWAHALGQSIDLHLMLRLGVAVAINDRVPQLLGNLAIARPTVLVAVPRVFGRIYDGVLRQVSKRPPLIQKLFHQGMTLARRRLAGKKLSLLDSAVLRAIDAVLFAKIRARFGGCLRFAICGSAALEQEVAEFVAALGIEIYEGYGLTECSPVVSVNTPRLRHFGTVGPPLRGTTLAIDPARSPDDPSSGEILVKGPGVMRGYHGLPEETAQVLTDDGWLRTGDLGRLDEAGCLIITGRLKEQYKLENGKFIAPAPIEEKIRLSPLVSQCLILGANLPHNIALVVPELSTVQERLALRAATQESLAKLPEVFGLIKAELDRVCRDLSPMERPRKVVILPEEFTIENGLLTPSHKMKRGEIQHRYAAEIASVTSHSAS